MLLRRDHGAGKMWLRRRVRYRIHLLHVELFQCRTGVRCSLHAVYSGYLSDSGGSPIWKRVLRIARPLPGHSAMNDTCRHRRTCLLQQCGRYLISGRDKKIHLPGHSESMAHTLELLDPKYNNTQQLKVEE